MYLCLIDSKRFKGWMVCFSGSPVNIIVTRFTYKMFKCKSMISTVGVTQAFRSVAWRRMTNIDECEINYSLMSEYSFYKCKTFARIDLLISGLWNETELKQNHHPLSSFPGMLATHCSKHAYLESFPNIFVSSCTQNKLQQNISIENASDTYCLRLYSKLVVLGVYLLSDLKL